MLGKDKNIGWLLESFTEDERRRFLGQILTFVDKVVTYWLTKGTYATSDEAKRRAAGMFYYEKKPDDLTLEELQELPSEMLRNGSVTV